MNLSIDTSFYSTATDPYSDTPSPASSMPSTPQSSQDLCFSMYGSDAGLTPSAPDYGSSYSYFPDVSPYSESIAPAYPVTNPQTSADSSYFPAAKSNFQYYEKPGAVASYDTGLAPPFMSTYAM
ncbi:hypothetical protein NM688_g4879 [Phlebia brevispora]|uniref:Uncharacterized protein n=1 Tax=Phlebia brevispora TaxID=194682 RepID=A0ACC1T290_9APHY|nr:hypothetical protein NM688_g4879 [Phlebia brevispora]